MATHQPLLDQPLKRNVFSFKTFILVSLSVVAIVTPLALVSIRPFSNTNNVNSDHHICDKAHDPASCLTMVTGVVGDVQLVKKPDLLSIFLNDYASRVSDSIKLAKGIHSRANDLKEQAVVADCVELMDSSIDRIRDSIVATKKGDKQSLLDAHAWLSSVLTNHVTCMDGLHGSTRPELVTEVEDLVARARTSLAMFVAISPPDHDDEVTTLLNGKLPSWIMLRDRKLLEDLLMAVHADVVVAKDGSGKYKTVTEAVNGAPVKSKTRYVIYVKKGIYKEKVEIAKNKKNLMIVGDGMDATIITGSLNVVDGATTFNSATVIVSGDGFIAQDICFQNTAGAVKHQAVALRVSADQVVINRCRIDAYQDTLYTHTLRQFYRDSTVMGTVDFIFGDSSVVLQNCKLIPRKPSPGQNNMLTAQGRRDPNQNTGISIQKCDIQASSDLAPVKSKFKTYLGRPWKEYSRTVVMQTNIGDIIDPAGWSPWSGDFALKTLYYGEYMNKGPGAGTSNRVKWPGYHVIRSAAEANKFTVRQLIQGGVWLKSTGVSYTEGL